MTLHVIDRFRVAAALSFCSALAACGGSSKPPAPGVVGTSTSATDVRPDREFHVPTTLSSEAQAILRSAGQSQVWKLRVPAPTDLDGWRALRAKQEAAAEPGVQKAIERNKVTVTATTLGGVPVLDIRPAGWQDDGKVIVFTHGGAYTMNSARSGLPHAAPMARLSGRRVVSIDYTTAPFATWREIQGQAIAVFAALREAGHRMQDIAIFGASAGGGLAMSTVLNLRDGGLGMPAAVLWSPWADLTDEGDTARTLRDADPMLDYEGILGPSARAFAAGLDLRDPRVSPLYADFRKGFPPTLIQEGTKTTFLSTSVRVYQALDAAGQSPVIDLYEGMVHVFQQLPIPEAETAIAKSARFINDRLGAGAKLSR